MYLQGESHFWDALDLVAASIRESESKAAMRPGVASAANPSTHVTFVGDTALLIGVNGGMRVVPELCESGACQHKQYACEHDCVLIVA